MKYFSSIILLICLCSNPVLSAQDTGVSCDQSFNYKVEKNEYGSYVLQVRPYVKAPCGHPVSDMEKKYKLWGVLVCYTVDGQQ